MNTNDIDRTHIVALQEVNGMLQNVTLPISRPEQFIDELKAMIENPNRTVWDMQSHFQKRFPKTLDYHNYLYPYSYSSSYVGGIEYPNIIGYNDLMKSWNEAAQTAQEEYENECSRYGRPISDLEIKEHRESAIEDLKYRQKASFNKDANRWIDACCYNNTATNAYHDKTIKMFSKENIGWSSFTHKVNQDIVVELLTNFGYGSAAYFLLAVKYKGLAILPYSYIVKYYKANMTDIVRCTRNYFTDSCSGYNSVYCGFKL